MASTSNDVSINLTHSLDHAGDYDAFTQVRADILLEQSKIGFVEATLIHRENIPVGYFLSAMDAHSEDMQYMSSTMYEPVQGRPKLRSLAEYDDAKHDTIVIDVFHLDEAYKVNGTSDIGSIAVRQFLRHPFIRGTQTSGRPWKTTSAVYIIDPKEAMTDAERAAFLKKRNDLEIDEVYLQNRIETAEEQAKNAVEERRLDALARLDANQFLRNGFFQDAAIVRQGEDRFLVASCGHWSRNMLSHDQAAAIEFPKAPYMHAAPTGKDAEILQIVMDSCSRSAYSFDALLAPMELVALVHKVTVLVSTGGSVSRSHAIHAACANNNVLAVKALLRLEESNILVDSLDVDGCTPLMRAAISAGGRRGNTSVPETSVIDFLLTSGANKDIEDPSGLTAYGLYVKRSKDLHTSSVTAMRGRAVMGGCDSSDDSVARKLKPAGGPTVMDRTGGGGEGAEAGFVEYPPTDSCCGNKRRRT